MKLTKTIGLAACAFCIIALMAAAGAADSQGPGGQGGQNNPPHGGNGIQNYTISQTISDRAQQDTIA